MTMEKDFVPTVLRQVVLVPFKDSIVFRIIIVVIGKLNAER